MKTKDEWFKIKLIDIKVGAFVAILLIIGLLALVVAFNVFLYIIAHYVVVLSIILLSIVCVVGFGFLGKLFLWL